MFFLTGCEECPHQNKNESLHHVIWETTTKEQFTFHHERGGMEENWKKKLTLGAGYQEKFQLKVQKDEDTTI